MPKEKLMPLIEHKNNNSENKSLISPWLLIKTKLPEKKLLNTENTSKKKLK